VSQLRVTIVGAGPAGLFAALEIAEVAPRGTLTLIDSGSALQERQLRVSPSGRPLEWQTGFGGSGLFMGGRLSLNVGSLSGRPHFVEPEDARGLQDAALRLITGVAEVDISIADLPQNVRDAGRRAERAGLTLLSTYPLWHLSEPVRTRLLEGIRSRLSDAGADVRTSMSIDTVAQVQDGWRVTTTAGEQLDSTFLLLAPGRFGAAWLAEQIRSVGLRAQERKSFGVRIEAPSSALTNLAGISIDPRLTLDFEGRSYRTYAFVVGGSVVAVDDEGEKRVTARPSADSIAGRTSFAILADRAPDELPDETVSRCTLGALLGTAAVSHTSRVAEMTTGRTSSIEERVPVLPDWYLSGLREFLLRCAALEPRVLDENNWVFSPSIESVWEYDLTQAGEVPSPGLFLAGDGAGVSQGAMAAAISGMLAGRAIGDRLAHRVRTG
jgi:uncharacterized FAD-dependent dehydrogenase